MLFTVLILQMNAVGAGSIDSADPSTWEAGDDIVIPAGQVTVVEQSTPSLGALSVHGTLRVADLPIELTAERIMIASGGTLAIGSPELPQQSKTIITLTEADTGQGMMGNRVLGVMAGGTLSIHGERGSDSWTQLAADALPGATSIQLAQSMDWQVGDRLVVAASGFHANEAELLTVTSVADRTIRFTPALQYPHLGHIKVVEGRDLDLRAEVGLLTRTVTIQAPVASQTDEFGFHAMFMSGAEVQLSGVEMVRGGQIGKPGRYPVHWHGVNEPSLSAAGSYIKNSAVHRSFQRGVVTHDVNDVLVQNNVVYDVWNHAYVPSESGYEGGNQYINNLAVLYKRRPNEDFSFPRDDHTESDQAEHRPAGFWLRNYHNTLVGNHAAGGEQGIGFFIDAAVMPLSPRQFICADTRPVVFQDNLAHSHWRTLPGAGIPTYGPKTRTSGLMVNHFAGNDCTPAVFERFTAYKNALAGVWIESRHHTFQESILADSSMAIFNHQATISDVVAIQQTDNLIGGENQIIGNRRHLGGGMHFQGGFRHGGDTPRVDGVTFVGFEPAAFTMWKDVLNDSPWPRVSNIRLIDTVGFWSMARDGAELETSRFIDIDGSVSGTGQLTHIGGRQIAQDAPFWPEFNAYVSIVAESNFLFGDSFEDSL